MTAAAAKASALRFFLGGRDLEMREISRLLDKHAPGQALDKNLAWGARLSDYRDEIEGAHAHNLTPVAVELADDMPDDWAPRTDLHVVDHHGERAGKDQPSSLEQTFRLLGLPKRSWTRRMALVAANDIGHVAGLKAAGATAPEIEAIRAEDRRAQGIKPKDEAEARRAIAARATVGALTVVETASSTSSAVGDLMLPDLGGPGYESLLVILPDKLAFFGGGETIAALAKQIPNSWWGGALPEKGYWGCAAKTKDRERLVRLVRGLAERRG